MYEFGAFAQLPLSVVIEAPNVGVPVNAGAIVVDGAVKSGVTNPTKTCPEPKMLCEVTDAFEAPAAIKDAPPPAPYVTIEPV